MADEETNRDACSHKGKLVKSYTFEKKLEIIKVAEKTSKAAAARKFNVDRRTVAEWCKKKDAIVEMACQNKGKFRKRLQGAGRKPLSETLESALMEWILERRAKGLRVSRLLVMKKAKVCVYEHIYIEISTNAERRSCPIEMEARASERVALMTCCLLLALQE